MSRAVIKPIHTGYVRCSPSPVWAHQPSAALLRDGQRHGGFAEWDVGNGGPLCTAAFDPITAADSRDREEVVKLQFVTAELLLDSN